jgi:isopentenyl diphosphate isomerase/L-lactate dehydrogenase-like FMN-dependent dehydrogenase
VGPMSRVDRAIERARDAGVKALAITFDTSVGSLRERDGRTGGTRLLGTSRLRAAPHFFPLTLAPRWLAAQLANGIRPKLMNVLDEDGRPGVLGQTAPTTGLTWEDLPRIRQLWPGPFLIKGLITAADARRAVEEGASGVIVSNHGGRQLDSADATLRVLPEIVAAVGDRCEVLLDGGVRSGIDVMKAVSLGAKAVLIGRPWVFGLGARGEAGVDGILKVIGDGMRRNMALLGAKSVLELDRSSVRAPAEWFEPSGWESPSPAPDPREGASR